MVPRRGRGCREKTLEFGRSRSEMVGDVVTKVSHGSRTAVVEVCRGMIGWYWCEGDGRGARW